MSKQKENARHLLRDNCEASINPFSGALTIGRLEIVTAVYLAYELTMKVEEIYGKYKEYDGYTWQDAKDGIKRNIAYRRKQGLSADRRIYGELRPVGRNLAVRVEDERDYPRGGATLKADCRNRFEDHPTLETRTLIQRGFLAVLDEVELPFTDQELKELLQ